MVDGDVMQGRINRRAVLICAQAGCHRLHEHGQLRSVGTEQICLVFPELRRCESLSRSRHGYISGTRRKGVHELEHTILQTS